MLQVPLPNWGSVRNCLTVWKRTRSTVLEGDRYAYIPVRPLLPLRHSCALLRWLACVCWAVQEEERLDLTMAAPSTQHLLSEDA